MKNLLLAALLCASPLAALPAHADALPLRDQARLIDQLTAERFDTVLPGLMQRNGIDMWILVSREYNEDPVLRTMLPAEWLSARRRTILVFARDPANGTVEKLAIARYNVGSSIQAAWDMQRFPKQWDALAELVRSRKPGKIGLNTSATFGHADGLDHTDYKELMAALPAAYRNKVVSAEALAVGWLETRTPRELALYPQLVADTHKIIAQGFSAQVITPGTTTTEDVVWWFREKIRAMGYETWFHPTVTIQRAGAATGNVIQPGDLLHVDIGISSLRLNTDVQQHAYVARPGETAIPAGILAVFGQANRLQDIVLAQFQEGRSGNQVLAAALAQAKTEGIKPTIYSHPIGYHGHAAGPAIGMWDMQGGVTGSGDARLRASTAYSIELNAEAELPEWQKPIRIMLEEDAWFDGKTVHYFDGRQRQPHLIVK
ncbi:M24 family metallopeptidase [Pseudoduganella sp. DS3]|uniref:M24 family metallopeptidase n=1 Tax=Pseudoduganella guangdongensis TaxID=2692179 RepID=A0A6N9HGE3_9BURK|nr:M24 family metallopeptidase [Pseudoduganella guangdongensis]MYN02614.1 M24 family metallopeptidase [Pseudoduganella guangdongensis]